MIPTNSTSKNQTCHPCSPARNAGLTLGGRVPPASRRRRRRVPTSGRRRGRSVRGLRATPLSYGRLVWPARRWPLGVSSNTGVPSSWGGEGSFKADGVPFGKTYWPPCSGSFVFNASLCCRGCPHFRSSQVSILCRSGRSDKTFRQHARYVIDQHASFPRRCACSRRYGPFQSCAIIRNNARGNYRQAGIVCSCRSNLAMRRDIYMNVSV